MRRREFITLLGGAAGMAARGARAAAGDAGDRLSSQRIGCGLCGFRGRIPQGAMEAGYVEGRERRDRISLGAKVTTIACRRWRPIWSAGGWL